MIEIVREGLRPLPKGARMRAASAVRTSQQRGSSLSTRGGIMLNILRRRQVALQKELVRKGLAQIPVIYLPNALRALVEKRCLLDGDIYSFDKGYG
jgi:hypothetical protein